MFFFSNLQQPSRGIVGHAHVSTSNLRLISGFADARRPQHRRIAPVRAVEDEGLQYPSRATREADAPGGWLWAFQESHQVDRSKPPAGAQVRNAKEAWKAVVAKGVKGPEAARAIEEIAVALNITVGKWIVREPPEKVDALWQPIAQAVKQGRLGPSAKVLASWARSSDFDTRGPEAVWDTGNVGGDHVICVYTKDFKDTKDVQRVREELRRLGVTKVLYYKADIYTYLKIYASNAKGHGIKASLYSG